MARHQVQFAKPRSGTSSILPKVEEAPAEKTKAYPLVLRPLLSQNRRLTNASIRVERVPQRARLSAGQNNGDRSWSLTRDDLDDLIYLLPADLDEPHSLSVRVIDRDGTTITVIEYKIPPEDKASQVDSAGAASRPAGPQPADDGAIRALHNELAQTKAALSTVKADSEERARQIDHEWTLRAREMVDDALFKARTEWASEISDRLKSVADRTEQTLVQRRQAWQAELEAHVADTARQAEDALALARESWQREAAAALSKGQASWETAESVRMAAAEARWNDQVAAARAETQTLASQSERDRAAIAQLREQLKTTKQSVEDLAGEVQSARNDAARATEIGRAEGEAALSAAKNNWQIDEAGRLAAAKAAWREESDAALTETAARQERTEKALEEAKARIEQSARAANQAPPPDTNDRVAELLAELAAKETALAQTREQVQREVAAKMTEAREEWELEEGARLAAAEARWREQASSALAEETARRRQAEATAADAQEKALAEFAQCADAKAQALQELVNTLRSALESRVAELQHAHEKSQRDEDEALAQARKAWEVDESARLADAHVQWQAESREALDKATRRCEVAEQQLAEARSQHAAEPQERVESLRLRDEIARLRINLELKDVELRQTRIVGAATQPHVSADGQLSPLPRGRMALKSAPGEKPERAQRDDRSLVRDAALVAAAVFLLALVPLLRSYIEPTLPYEWQDAIDAALGESNALPPSSTTASKPKPKAAPQPPASQTDIVLQPVRLRADPSTAARVLAILPRGTRVTVIGQKGDWVQVTDAGHQGWVLRTHLKAVPAP